MIERKETTWCVGCGARFTHAEVDGHMACPACKSEGIPCSADMDIRVEVNWHELRILVIWAENWAAQSANQPENKRMPLTVAAIARRLESQCDFGRLTLSGEISELPRKLAENGISVGGVESNIPKPMLFVINGPGAVGQVK